jgi:hypothetical protein
MHAEVTVRVASNSSAAGLLSAICMGIYLRVSMRVNMEANLEAGELTS